MSLAEELARTEHDLAVAVAEATTARAEAERLRAENDEQKRLLLDETYRPEGGEIVMRELSRVKAERDELRAEVKRLCADVSDSSRLIWKQAQLLTDLVNAVRGEPGRLELHSHHDAPELVQAVVADRDALSARLQAVRVLADEGEHECSEACELFDCDANRRYLVAKDRILDALDASLGTPGDEKPQATKRRAAAGGTRLVALMQAANAIRNHRNEERRPEVAGLNAAAEIIDRMIGGEAFPIGPPSVAPTPIKPVGSSGSASGDEKPQPCEQPPHAELWSVHVHGPDDVVLFDSQWEAEAYAAAIFDVTNPGGPLHPTSPFDPKISAHVISPARSSGSAE